MNIQMSVKNILIAAASAVGLILAAAVITSFARLKSLNNNYENKVKEQAQYLINAKLSVNDIIA